MAAAGEAQFDAVVDRALALHAFAKAERAKQVDGALLEHAGANRRLDIGAAAVVEHDRLDALPVQQVRKQKARRACADDANLGAHRHPPRSAVRRRACCRG